MNRERALELVENLLQNLHAGQEEWPLSLLTEVYVFGSFSRGSLEPHDLDIDIEYDSRGDEKWTSHLLFSMSYGRDPYSIMRKPLTSGKRGYQFTFEDHDTADFEMTLLWRRGDSLAASLDRLHAIQPDPAAGRAPRDSMLPEFEGIEDWLHRPHREALVKAVEDRVIKIERMALPDGGDISVIGSKHISRRWNPSSPLLRAATAIISHWERQGIDPGNCHLHGIDIRDKDTPYFAGMGLRYFGSIPRCLSRFGGVEWLEVVHPTKARALDCLRITPIDTAKLAETRWR